MLNLQTISHDLEITLSLFLELLYLKFLLSFEFSVLFGFADRKESCLFVR